MWKKEDAKSQPVAENPPSNAIAPPPANNAVVRETSANAPVSGRAAACISQGIRIKGEVTGSEDLFVDGHVEGKLNLSNGSLTVGPNGDVKADITAREVIVRGRVDGKIVGREKIQLWSTGNVSGDLQTERLAIEDGAVLSGRVEIETGKPVNRNAESRGTTSPTAKTATASVGSGSAGD